MYLSPVIITLIECRRQLGTTITQYHPTNLGLCTYSVIVIAIVLIYHLGLFHDHCVAFTLVYIRTQCYCNPSCIVYRIYCL
jgi:hypothetical protein